MTILIRIIQWLRRLIGYALVTVLVVLLGTVLVVGFTPFGARIAADQIARITSTPDRTITIGEPTGLLTGALRIGTITVSDTKGVYAEIRDLAVDWSPLSLLAATFDAQRISAGAIDILRSPVKTEIKNKPDASSGGFSLPIAFDIAQITAPDIRLGSELAGRDFALAAEGRAKSAKDRIELALSANRQDQPDAKATADILFAPQENRLTLNAVIVEPQGGLLARMLQLPGEPAIKIHVDGQGPLSDWSGKIAADVNEQSVVAIAGRHQMPSPGVHRIDLKGGGTLDTLLPPTIRPLFAGETNIDVALTFDDKGSLSIDTGNVTTGSFLLAASGNFDPSGGNNLKANLIGAAGPIDVRWPLADGEAHLLIDGLDLSLSGAAKAAVLDLTTVLRSVEIPQGRFGDIHLSAKSDGFDLPSRSGPVGVELSVEETAFTSPDLERAIRGPLKLIAPLKITPTEIGFYAATLESASIGGTVNGRYDLPATTLTSDFHLFALPAVLPEAIAAKFENTIAMDGKVTAVVGGPTDVTDLTVKSSTVEAKGNVSLDGENLSAHLSGRLPEIGKLVENAKGAAEFSLSASGPVKALTIKATANADSATLAGRALESLEVSIDGKADMASPQATVKASGALDGQKINVDAELISENGETRIPGLTAVIGPNSLAGDMRFTKTFEPSGNLTFDFPDIGLLAALAGQKASGDLKGSLALKSDDGRIAATIKATGSGFRRDDIAISRPDIDLVIDDLKAVSASGTVRLAELASGANKVSNLALEFTQTGNTTGFDLKASYDGAPLLVTGSANNTGGTTTVALRNFSAKPRGIPVQLASPTTVTVRDGTATLSKLVIQTGAGSVTVDGTAGATLDISARIAALPASLANTFAADLGAAGAISGTVSAKGKAADPTVNFDLAWANAVVRASRAAGLSGLDIKAKGQFAAKTLKIDANVTGQSGLALSAGGTVQVAANPANSVLDITAKIANLPASLANAFVPGLGAEGAITGSLTAKDKASDPVVGFDLAWARAVVSQTRTAGLTALDIKAKGQLAANILTIDTNLTGQSGLALSGGGTLAITGNKAINMRFTGGLPFTAFSGPLATQGLTMDGRANINVNIAGTTASPAITGSITTDKAKLTDVRRNLALNELGITLTLDRDRATVSRLSAKLSSGGTLSATGTIGIAPGSGFPADITLTLNRANYVDGTLFSALTDGTLTLRGPLLTAPVLGGSLKLTKASVNIPERLPPSLAEIDIKHRNAPARVTAQMKKLAGDNRGGGSSSPIGLDLTVSAPSKIFVRGRGIDAELGGELTVRGTGSAPIVSGGFEMRRGRMVILNRRLDFTTGNITFSGSLTPMLNMDASTKVGSTTITVSVNGLANDPKITFASSPALPQDEILAQLIFGQSMSRLSALQIAQLADAASQLAGGRSTSLFQSLRKNLGVDDLDISTDEKGRAKVSAGKYLNDRTYLELQQGGDSGGKAIINLDVGRGVKLRGEAGADGSGAAGIFYEKEY